MEKDVMSKAKTPRIISLAYCFHDDMDLYFVTELCPGGDLQQMIAMAKEDKESEGVEYQAMDLEHARFYTAEVLIGLRYLHSTMKVRVYTAVRFRRAPLSSY
jgi:serine/threonine protein kinase